jgi:hypothetical protein
VVGGRSRGNCAPVVVVVLTPSAAGWVVGTVEGAVATGVEATVGVGIVGGVAVVPAGIVGTAVATTGGALLGGAMTGPDGAVTPCVLAATVVLLLPSSSPPDSTRSWCLKCAMGQRLTGAGAGPSTYLPLPVREPATQSVPYSQAIWDCQAPRSSFAGYPPQPGPSTSRSGFGWITVNSRMTSSRPLWLGGSTRR